jgi:anti-anti-sigma regulatory factor
VLRCLGSEDRRTQSERRGALARAMRCGREVIVDLGELSHADASLMVDLAMLSRRLRRRGLRVILRDPQPQVLALIEGIGVHRLPAVELERASLA